MRTSPETKNASRQPSVMNTGTSIRLASVIGLRSW